MEKGDKGSMMIRMGVTGWMFLLVPVYPGCPGSKAVKRSLLLLFYDCKWDWVMRQQFELGKVVFQTFRMTNCKCVTWKRSGCELNTKQVWCPTLCHPVNCHFCVTLPPQGADSWGEYKVGGHEPKNVVYETDSELGESNTGVGSSPRVDEACFRYDTRRRWQRQPQWCW